jgi:NADH-quinone oxidoreductase subunit C
VTESHEQNQEESLPLENPEHPAVAALNQAAPDTLLDAKFDRGELTLTVARESILEVCRALRSAGFNFLCDVTCVDLYPNPIRFRVTYHLLSHSLKQRVRIAVLVAEDDAAVDSITPIWPAANFYEREVFDLFGVRFGGHPNLRRIMMPEGYNGNPLRKDFPVEGYR